MRTENLPVSRAPQRQADLQDLLAILIAAGLVLVIHQNGTGIPRILLALAFTCYVPGRAIVSNWPAFGRWSAAATPVALSIAVLAIIATASLWAHHWHPLGIFQVEAVISIVLLLIGLIRRQVRHGQGRDYPAPGAPDPAASNGYDRRFDDDRFLDDEDYDEPDETAEPGWGRRRRQPAARRAGRDEHSDGADEDRWPREDRRGEVGRRRIDPRLGGNQSRGEGRESAEDPGLEANRRPTARRRPGDDRPSANPVPTDDQLGSDRAPRMRRRPSDDRPARDPRPRDHEPRSDRPPRVQRWSTDDGRSRNPLPTEDEPRSDRPPQARRWPGHDRPRADRQPGNDRPSSYTRPMSDESRSDRPPQARRRPSDDRPDPSPTKDEPRRDGPPPRVRRRPSDDRPRADRQPGTERPSSDRPPRDDEPRSDRPPPDRPSEDRPPRGHRAPEQLD